MSKLANVEKIEKTIQTVSSHFTVKNTVITGVKGKDNVKLNPVYARSYNSTKYSDKSQLEAMNIRTSDYIVLAYNDYQNKINEEVYLSYPHLPNFINLLEQAVQMVSTKDMYVNNDVNPKYSDVVLRLDNLGGKKSIAIIPHVIQQDQTYINGALIFLNSEDTYAEIDANSIYTLYYILKDFNLYLNSSLLLLTGLLYDGGTSDFDSAPVFGGASKNAFGANNANNRAPRGIFGGKGGSNIGGSKGGFKPPVKNTTLEELDKVIEGEEGDIPSTNGDETSNNEGEGSPLSLNKIIDAAGEIEVPDLDDGEVVF